jgi:hypothetical protein
MSKFYIYSRTLLRSLSRDQRIRDFLSRKTYEEGKRIKSNRIVTSTLNNLNFSSSDKAMHFIPFWVMITAIMIY